MATGAHALRISQTVYERRKPWGYQPEIESDGLTVDTPSGPVDLVAVERVQEGRLTPVTLADVRYAVGQLPDGTERHVLPLASGLGITNDAVKRAYERHKRTIRTRGGD
jgi:hypothetical protein